MPVTLTSHLAPFGTGSGGTPDTDRVPGSIPVEEFPSGPIEHGKYAGRRGETSCNEPARKSSDPAYRAHRGAMRRNKAVPRKRRSL